MLRLNLPKMATGRMRHQQVAPIGIQQGICKSAVRPVTPVRRQPMQREKPSRPPSEAASEPKEQEPERPGFLFGFWKQTYPNDDIKGQPKTGVPAPGDMEYHYPHTYDPVSQPPPVETTAPAQAAAEASKKNCAIQ